MCFLEPPSTLTRVYHYSALCGILALYMSAALRQVLILGVSLFMVWVAAAAALQSLAPLQWTMQCLDKNTPYLFSTWLDFYLIMQSRAKIEYVELFLWALIPPPLLCKKIWLSGGLLTRHDYHWRCKKENILGIVCRPLFMAALPHSIHMDFMSTIFRCSMYALKRLTAFS